MTTTPAKVFLKKLLSIGAWATGTFRLTQQNTPTEIAALKETLNPRALERGTGILSSSLYTCAGRTVELFWLCPRYPYCIQHAVPLLPTET